MVNELEKEVNVEAFQEEIARLSEKLQKEQGQWERERVQWAQVTNQLPNSTLTICTMMVREEPGKGEQNRIRFRGQRLNSHIICMKLVHRFNRILLIKTNCRRSFSRSM